MAVTLSILDRFAKFFQVAKSMNKIYITSSALASTHCSFRNWWAAEFQLTTAVEVKKAGRVMGSRTVAENMRAMWVKGRSHTRNLAGARACAVSYGGAGDLFSPRRSLIGRVFWQAACRPRGLQAPGRPGPADGAAPRRHSGSDRRPLSVDGRPDGLPTSRPAERSLPFIVMLHWRSHNILFRV